MRDTRLLGLKSWTVAEAAEALQVPKTTVRRWIAAGHLSVEPNSSPVRVAAHPFPDTLYARLRSRIERPKSYIPIGIGRYAGWHHFLDEFVWLIKVLYSPTSDIKKKRFRLDLLYSEYLRKNRVNRDQLRKDFQFASTSVANDVWKDLARGWYNECAFSFPTKVATLGLSFADIDRNQESTESRLLFPSWRIVTAYYAVYFYLRALARLKQSTFRLTEHNATLVNFKACVIAPLSRHAWRAPFNLEYNPHERSHSRPPELDAPHLRYKYSSHPRNPHRSPKQIAARVRTEFRLRGNVGPRPNRYTLFDYLRDLRVWANYLEIEQLLNLRGHGYRAFLDQSLSTIVFFVGGIAECVLLAATTPTQYRNRAQRFYNLMSDASPDYERSFRYFPMSQRVEIMHQMKWLPRPLAYREYPDINAIMIR